MSVARVEGSPVGAGIVVRACGEADHGSIERLGHPPAVADLFCATLSRRVVWRLTGTRAVPVLAQEVSSGEVLSSVQFLRSRRSRDTWMFGHWRTAAARRRQGHGRRVLQKGLRLLPGVRRLYSYVDWGNETSIAAHERLGFEAGLSLWGGAPLGLLSTIGTPTPALRLEPVEGGDWSSLFSLYARAMGTLWLRLFPAMTPRTFLAATRGGLRAAAIAVARAPRLASARVVRAGKISADRSVSGFVLWEGAAVTLFVDPETCDPSFLARVALQVIAQGTRRDLEIRLRGIPRSLAARPGPIQFRVLMGMPDVGSQWRD